MCERGRLGKWGAGGVLLTQDHHTWVTFYPLHPNAGQPKGDPAIFTPPSQSHFHSTPPHVHSLRIPFPLHPAPSTRWLVSVLDAHVALPDMAKDCLLLLRRLARIPSSQQALMIAVPSAVNALRLHAANSGVCGVGLVVFQSLALHKDNKEVLGPAVVPVALEALRAHGRTAGVVKPALGCLRNLSSCQGVCLG
jgi:hypothetical protein